MRIYLQSAEQSETAPRFYHIWLQQDLINGWTLITESGYQGSPGRVRKKHYDDLETAQKGLQSCRDRQIKRGYRVVFIQGQDHNTTNSPPQS